MLPWTRMDMFPLSTQRLLLREGLTFTETVKSTDLNDHTHKEGARPTPVENRVLTFTCRSGFALGLSQPGLRP